ncbi:MAG TPA: UbiA family prenyltransferase [Allosphingosinicella sp.]|nr:UbiA family prenyltransferase [Allosphingosinicella sp.]
MIHSARRFLLTLRAGQWWDHKLPPALAIFYATLFLSGRAVAPAAAAALALLVAIAAAAAFVSVLNDLADRADDAVAGKPNGMAGRGPLQAALLVGVPLAVGLSFLAVWRRDLVLALAYGGIWIAFALYSLPPFRLKRRGLPGILADACGAHVLPALTALLLASAAAGRAPDLPWAAFVALWSLAYGIRGILWHQLLDIDNDRRAGIATFARRLSPARTARLATRIVFPIEAAALAAMLLWLGSLLPLLFLLLYLLLLAGLGVRIVIVASERRWAMALQDYDELFLPVSILCASALVHPFDGLVLLAQLVLFPRRPLRILARLAQWTRPTFSRGIE